MNTLRSLPFVYSTAAVAAVAAAPTSVMASLRHRRRGIVAVKDYDDDDDDIHDDGSSGTAPDTDDTATDDPEEEVDDDDEEEEDEEEEVEEEEEEEEGDRRHLRLGLQSMTAKGIQHLCSELLEIKKASEQDFSANVYLSYLSFIRMFEEAGDLDKDVHQLKRQVMAHRRLVQHLSSSCLYSSSSASMVLPGSKEEAAADMAGILLALPDHRRQRERDEELELDELLSEHRMDEALQLLERQAQALQTMQQQQAAATSPFAGAAADDDAEAIAIALSARKARVADRLASLAENPRTPRPELEKALSGLCRLGDGERASRLLFEVHRAGVARGVEELRSRGGGGGGNYIRDLARVVFSAIVRTARSFVALHGQQRRRPSPPSPHTARLVRWAREEMEDLSAAFSEYVRSMSSPPAAATAAHSLALALEAAECAASYSPLLAAVGVVASEHDVVGLVVPCVRDAVAMYGRHLKEVVRLLVASDAWVLGRFLLPPGLHAAAGAPQPDYCLLTTNGRKFVTLIQEVVEDVAWPLHKLGIGTNDSVGLQLVAELFREYMHAIVEIIPGKEAAAALQLQDEANGGDERYTWQLAVLINCTTLVSLFPAMASGVFRTPPPPPPPSSSSGFPASAQREVDSLISVIKEAAGQVWSCFCQQFIRDTMSSAVSGSETPAPARSTTTMPSMAFQVVFLRVRRLGEVYGAILSGEDGTMKKLLRELVEAMIGWLSSNLDSWAVHGDAQVQLDVHFLLEFAQLGGFSSDNIRSSAMDLLAKAQAEKVVPGGGEPDDVVAGDEDSCVGGWAADAAKHAVQVLLAIGDEDDAGEEPDETARWSGDDDDEAGQEEAPPEDEDEDEDEYDQTGAANKSSEEFISMEDEEDEDGGGVRMIAPAALSSENQNQSPGYSEKSDGEERTNVRSGHHPELEHAAEGTGGDGDNVTQDEEEGMCNDAVQQEVEEQSSSSWEDIIDGEGGRGGSSRTLRLSTPLVMAAAAKDAPSRSRKKREAVSRSSKPRWHI